MFAVLGAGAHLLLLVQQEHVPAFVVVQRLVPAVQRELLCCDCAVLLIDASAKSLHVVNELMVAVGIDLHVSKKIAGRRRGGSEQDESFVY